MSKYAQDTEVPVERSRSEIETTLRRYGASGFMYGWEEERAVLGFRINGRMIRIELSMPDRRDPAFTITETGRRRTSGDAIMAAYEQECRRRWRALLLVVKAKLEAVASEISTFDDEFMAFIVLPDNTTIGQHMRSQIAETYERGTMPPMLPGAMTTPALPSHRAIYDPTPEVMSE